MKRLCLYAGYNQSRIVEDYVVSSIAALSKHADVYYLAANAMHDDELGKLAPLVQGKWAIPHSKYDFGSWQKLIYILGWKTIESYDSLILINDSNYGPVCDIADVFAAMEDGKSDFWGITENYGIHPHLQSYFLCFTKRVFSSDPFREFFETINVMPSKEDICLSYEIGLTKLLCANGFAFSAYIDRMQLDVAYGEDISSFQNTILNAGSPFVKRKVFSQAGFAKEKLADTWDLLGRRNYPVSLISTSASEQSQEAPAAVEPAPSAIKQKNIVWRAIRKLLRPLKTGTAVLLKGPRQTPAEMHTEFRALQSSVDQMFSSLNNQLHRSHVDFAKSFKRGATRQELDQVKDSLVELHEHLDWVQRDILRSHVDLAKSFKQGATRQELDQVKGSLVELHEHLDWVQRDILIAIKNGIEFNAALGFRCVTDYPVAYDSPDHLHPVGTLRDHTRHPRFIRACEDYFVGRKRLSFLDLGCSAGGMVLDAALRGHIGVGLEGSDISRLQQRAEWRLLPESLFTCDITKPFVVTKDADEPYIFDVISAWEVMEHLTNDGVHGLFINLAKHTRAGSILACSISQVDGGFTDDGAPLHQTIEPLPWWRKAAEMHGFEVVTNSSFSTLDFARGSGNPSVYYRPQNSYKEQPGDCLLVIFRKL